jgi:hypothetical protein
MVQVLFKSKYLFLEVDPVPLLETHIYTLLIWDGLLGLVFCSQQSPTLVLHTKDILLCNTFSLEGLIFASLRQDFESLVELPFSLLHLHTPKFYCNSPIWFYGNPTSPCQSASHKILKGACLGLLWWVIHS